MGLNAAIPPLPILQDTAAKRDSKNSDVGPNFVHVGEHVQADGCTCRPGSLRACHFGPLFLDPPQHLNVLVAKGLKINPVLKYRVQGDNCCPGLAAQTIADPVQDAVDLLRIIES